MLLTLCGQFLVMLLEGIFFRRNDTRILSQQGLLATYLITGFVGRGVGLGSESSSGGAGGVWKSGNLDIWEFGDLGIWKSRYLGPRNPKKSKLSKFASVLPKMSARSGLVGNKSHPGSLLPWTGKICKNV